MENWRKREEKERIVRKEKEGIVRREGEIEIRREKLTRCKLEKMISFSYCDCNLQLMHYFAIFSFPLSSSLSI